MLHVAGFLGRLARFLAILLLLPAALTVVGLVVFGLVAAGIAALTGTVPPPLQALRN